MDGGQARRDRLHGECRTAARTSPARARSPAGGTRRCRPRRCRRRRSSGRCRVDAAPSRPLVSCSSATSPIRTAVGVLRASATPTAVDTTPSMPFAPRLAYTSTPVAGRGEPLDVAHGHRRREHERPVVGERRHHRARDTRLGVTVERREGLVDRELGDCFRARPSREPRRARCRASREPLRERGDDAAGSATTISSADRSGSIHAPRRATTTCTRLRGRQPLRQHLRRRLLAEPKDDLRAMVPSELGVPQQRIERSDGGARRHPSPGPGVGEHRPAEAFGQRVHSRAPAPRPATTTPRTASSTSASLSTAASSSSARSSTTECHGSSVGTSCRHRPRVADERIAERQVEVHRPGAAPARAESLGHDPRAERSPHARVTRQPALRRRRTTAPIRRRGGSGRSSGAPRPLAARVVDRQWPR